MAEPIVRQSTIGTPLGTVTSYELRYLTLASIPPPGAAETWRSQSARPQQLLPQQLLQPLSAGTISDLGEVLSTYLDGLLCSAVYLVQMRAKNWAGSSPWSPIIAFRMNDASGVGWEALSMNNTAHYDFASMPAGLVTRLRLSSGLPSFPFNSETDALEEPVTSLPDIEGIASVFADKSTLGSTASLQNLVVVGGGLAVALGCLFFLGLTALLIVCQRRRAYRRRTGIMMSE
ncbi:unnamed protein product [Protopolystoma xenopodis]|uniref:Uncharacterized protein n=1 Tax=Protopolystoma xenopodis TaxID=117903 RepID=A0A3S5FCC0_9PLAT|nr:unnamed protein product [Protopolystoma xenopodis]